MKTSGNSNSSSDLCAIEENEGYELVQMAEFSERSESPSLALSPSSVIDVCEGPRDARLKEVRELVEGPACAHDDCEERYSHLLRMAQSEDFRELTQMNFMYKTPGFDNAGHTVVVFLEDSLLPYLSVTRPEQLLLYVLQLLDRVSARSYVVVYVPSRQSNPVLFRTEGNAAEKASLRTAVSECYAFISAALRRLAPRLFVRNLRHFYVLLPRDTSLFWFRLYAGWYYFYSTFVARVWDVIEYVTDLRNFFSFVSPVYLRLPPRVFARLSGLTPVFGVPLSDAPSRRGADGEEYPAVVLDCLEVLMDASIYYPDILSFKLCTRPWTATCTRGYEEEDARDTVNSCITAYNFGERPDLGAIKNRTIVACLLRLYLSELPNPLLPQKALDELVLCRKEGTLSSEKICAILCEGVPPLQRRVLRSLLLFVSLVRRSKESSNSGTNKVVNYLFYCLAKHSEFKDVAPVLEFICSHNNCIPPGTVPVQPKDSQVLKKLQEIEKRLF